MSDGSLSQDEIDALLQGAGGMDFGQDDSPTAASGLSDQEKQSFLNVIRGIIPSQASNLSMLVGQQVSLQQPLLEESDREELLRQLPEEVVEVRIDFTEGLDGQHSFILDSDTSIAIAGLMMGLDGAELNDAAVSALQESLSQFFGPAVTVLGDLTGVSVMTGVPEGQFVPKSMIGLPDEEFVVLSYPLAIEGGDSMQLKEVFSLSTVREIVRLQGGPQVAAKPGNPRPVQGQQQAFGSGQGGGGYQQMGAPQGMGQGMQGMQNMQGMQGMMQSYPQQGFGMAQAGPNVQPVQFANLQPHHGSAEQGNIGLLMDVYMEMTVELGRTRKLIKEILGMGEGTIIELDKLAGEPVDILVNHKLIAKGEVVVIDENFGVRVTEIVSPMERMRDLT